MVVKQSEKKTGVHKTRWAGKEWIILVETVNSFDKKVKRKE